MIRCPSSNVPSSAMLNTLASSTEVICFSCSGETRPFGCMMKMLMRSRPAAPWIAALPVSPLVAPTMFRRPFSRPSWYSKKLLRNWSAMSLNARVGPWKSSSTWTGPADTTGATSGWANVA